MFPYPNRSINRESLHNIHYRIRSIISKVFSGLPLDIKMFRCTIYLRKRLSVRRKQVESDAVSLWKGYFVG